MLEIVGWVWIGILIGFIVGVTLISILASGRHGELEQENLHLKFVRDSLKDEILRLDTQSKPKPRKHRKR